MQKRIKVRTRIRISVIASIVFYLSNKTMGLKSGMKTDLSIKQNHGPGIRDENGSDIIQLNLDPYSNIRYEYPIFEYPCS